MTGFESKRRMALAKLEPSQWRDMVVVTLVREGIDKHRARELADHFAVQPEQEPTCPECKAGVLYECVACSNNNYPPKPEQEPVAKVVSTAPDKIWLDLGFDPQDETEVLFDELHDVTWSGDNASGYGIEYVRTTPPAAQPEQEPVAYYHPRKGFYWAKPTSIFAPTVMDVPPMALYTTPPAAQPEQEAYGIQAISQELMAEFVRLTKGKK